MPAPKSLAAYTDIEARLDTALRLDTWPAVVTCRTPAAATRWRARAHSFRALVRRMEEDRLGLNRGYGTSVYDDLIIRCEGPEVYIELRREETTLTIGGERVEPVADRALEVEADDDFIS